MRRPATHMTRFTTWIPREGEEKEDQERGSGRK